MNFKEWLQSEGKTNQDKVITITCRDYDNSLEDLINYIKVNGNTGHSFSIVVDPDSSDSRKTFEWDGDGSDRIHNISVSHSQNETMTSTSAIAGFARPCLPHVRRSWTPKFDELDDPKKKKDREKVYQQPQVED